MTISTLGGSGKTEGHAGVLTITSSSWASGVEKSMLARRLTTILPAMTLPDALETTRIHRVAGRTGARTASDVGLIGGSQMPLPGTRRAASPGESSMSRRRHLPTCSLICRACRLTHRWVGPHSGHIAGLFNPFVEVTHTTRHCGAHPCAHTFHWCVAV
jgi:hypothetical protein